MKVLTESEMQQALAALPNWHLEQGMLVRTSELPTFVQALTFVNQVAELAEQQNHHPDIDIRYNKVRLSLISHDANGITNRDTRLAASIDSLSDGTA